jgi:hypothetical protein
LVSNDDGGYVYIVSLEYKNSALVGIEQIKLKFSLQIT